MIKVNDKYAIDSDSHCWRVKKFKGIDKKGKEVWEPFLFLRTLDRAAQELTHLMVRESDYNSVTTLSLRVNEALEEVKAAIEPLSAKL